MGLVGSWIQAFRLRTLPLSFSSILVGSFIAIGENNWNPMVLTLALITTLFLQVLSNLANDLGDAKKGTDNADRIGPERAIQSGNISASAMKKGVWVLGALSLASGISLLYIGFDGISKGLIVFFVLGLLAIAAALFYTLGKKPYGYMGLGDVFVFLFFGILGVVGTHFLHTRVFSPLLFLPAAAIGMLSAGVLNLNNIRDHQNDASSGKRTVVVLFGPLFGKVYQTSLIIAAFICLVTFSLFQELTPWKYLYVLATPIFAVHVLKVWSIKEYKNFDGQLKVVALSTFFTSVLFCIGQVLT